MRKRTLIPVVLGIILSLLSDVDSATSTSTTPATCVPLSVADATYTPTGTINTGDSVTYQCDTGYNLTYGDLTLTCGTGGSWIGTTPVCSVVRCATGSVPFASKTPATTEIDYGTSVNYTCNTGYVLSSGNPSRSCQANGQLSGIVPVCSIVRCATSSVPFASKTPATSEIDYGTSVNYTCNTGYALSSGSASRSCQANGQLSGSGTVCSIINCTVSEVPYASVLPAATDVEYGSNVTVSCDVGYALSSGDEIRICEYDGQLSGTSPVCSIVQCAVSDVSNASVLPATSQVAYDTNVTYECDVGYELTSGDANRYCQADGQLSGNDPVCSIITCAAEDVLHAFRSPQQASYDYNTNVSYACDVGYEHTAGDLTRSCLANASWSLSAIVCTIKTCNVSTVANADMTPNQLVFDYNTAVTYTCNTGYYVSAGDATRNCQADTTWSGTAPTCSPITCSDPGNGTYASKSPQQASYSYNMQITYTCNIGYKRVSGDYTRTCTNPNAWSGALLICTIHQCNKETVTNGLPTPNTAKYNFNTSVTYTCNLGFNQTAGDLVRTCDANGTWTGTLPTCTVAACLPITISYGTYSPLQITYEFGTDITYTCTIGYYVSAGNQTRTCLNTGAWTGSLPTCSLVRCDLPSPVANSSHTPMLVKFDYNTVLTYTCDLSYNHTSGNISRTCQADFTWSGTEPVCTVVACIQDNSTYMQTTPNKILHEFGDIITYSCIQGYNYSSGDVSRLCQPDGIWNGTKPACIIITCDMLIAPAHATILPATREVNYNTNITYVCDMGYNRTGGDEKRRCTEFETFEGVEANCTLVTCDPPNQISKGSFTPVQTKYDYNSTANYTCDFGYYHFSGDLVMRCNEQARWLNTDPVCKIVQCSKPTEAHATVSPNQVKYDFNTSVTSTCVIGYNLTGGDATRTCLHTGLWDGTPPNCTIVECVEPGPVALSTKSPVKAKYVYQDVLTYTCVTGYEITSGTATRTCTETSAWTGASPNCTVIHCVPPPAGTRTSYVPDVADYIWNDNVTYTCDIGYNHSSGALFRTCQYDKTWSGATPVCTIVKCAKIDVPNMTFSPPTVSTNDFNTTIEYACVVGYNHSYGDLRRTCDANGIWTGTLPNCTIVECVEPGPVALSTKSPVKAKYVYQDVLTYTCVTGYEITSGNAARTCTETSAWTGAPPNCTVIHCVPPPAGTRTSYVPAVADYIWNDNVTYTCDIGYNYSSGALFRTCQYDKTWSGATPVCSVVKCSKIDVQHMTFSPPTANTHDFNTTIEYACVVGYNHSYGDLRRTCNADGVWTGTLPNCTIITCDPPDPIAHTFYTPVLVEHDWNTSINYSCDAGYHYVTGINKTTCNESGSFPPVDLDCSVQHTITVNVAEPSVTWLNDTFTIADTVFDFDGMCDVTISCSPDRFIISKTLSGSQITMTLQAQNGTTTIDEYVCSLYPFRGERTFPTVQRNVFYGDAIQGFQARLDFPGIYVEIGEAYHFEANATHGSRVFMRWEMEENISKPFSYSKNFRYMDFHYTFVSPKTYVEVFASNVVSSVSQIVPLYAIYALNGITFSVNQNWRTTTETATFLFDINQNASIPMADIDMTFTLHNGTGPFTITENTQNNLPLSLPFSYDVVYGVQGEYNVTVEIANPVSTLTLFQYMHIWDKLDSVNLSCVSNCFILIRESTMTVGFSGAPRSGFKYVIDFGDGNTLANTDDSIMFALNSLTNFQNIYNETGYYILQWRVYNGGYSKTGTIGVTVQNEVKDFQVYLVHPSIYLAIGDTYSFFANVTQGTNVTLDWKMEESITVSSVYQGEFTETSLTYNFKNPKTNIQVFASNLVSNVSQIVPLYAIYALNGITFTVNQNWRTTTETAIFAFDIDHNASIPMAGVNMTFTLHNGTGPFTLTENIQSSLPLSLPITYNVVYNVQGEYNVTVDVANPISSRTLFHQMHIWDKLDTVNLTCASNCFILVRGTTMKVEFVGVPRSGFKYVIDMGDGTQFTNTDDSIMYALYSLSTFDQTYNATGYFTLQWRVYNGGYSKTGIIGVTVQDEVRDFQVYLVHPSIYIAVGDTHSFFANVSQGTNVTLDWQMENNITVSSVYEGEFSYASLAYSFKNSKTNIQVFASNLVSNVSQIVPLYAIYALNGITFSVNQNWRTTTETAIFTFDINQNASIPMAGVNMTFTLHNGTGPFTLTENIQNYLPPSLPFSYAIVYNIQGEYNVTVEVANPISALTLFHNMHIWDKLNTVNLSCVSNCYILVRGTTMTVRFLGAPRSGFKYIIDMGDGTEFTNTDDSIMYALYSLTTFDKVYIATGYYILKWSVFNGGYYQNGTNIGVTVQDEIKDLKVYLLHPSIYLAVGDTYSFYANGTQGTNVTVDWQMEDNITVSNVYPGEFTDASLTYIFTKSKHNITVVGRNLVSSETQTVHLEVIYRINNFNFSVVNTLWNTTSPVSFAVHLLSTADIPMHEVNITIDFKYGLTSTDTKMIDDFHPVNEIFTYIHLFDMQGNFTVDLTLENVLGNQKHYIGMRIWDSLLPLRLDFVNAMNIKYVATNATAEFNFSNVPNYGFQYSIDFGDGTTPVVSSGDSIMYSKYSLGLFTHVYKKEGVYILQWTAKNGEPSYNRHERFAVHVQNKLPVDGFTLEPIGRKYPWINLQNMSVSINITLAAHVSIPTNATCTFNPKDNTGSVSFLPFASSFFEHKHNYLIEGIFNSTFNCSNEVSNEIYTYNLEVRKYQASFLSLIFHDYVPLNVSDSVTVYFHIDNGGFYLIPYHVYISWTFSDKIPSRRRRAPILYDRTSYTNDYHERGNYTVTIFVEAQVTNTTNTLTYSLRLGLMYFEYNTTIQFINTTVNRYFMYGVRGYATYAIDFDDTSQKGNCNATGGGSCDIYHLCPQYGYHLVQVTASNGTFIELDNINITCDNPIVNITMDIPYTVAIPDGRIAAKLRIKPTDLFLPLLFCNWNMGDPIERETFGPTSDRGPGPQTVTYESPFLFNFQYIALGRHTITIFCWNLINETKLQTQITVTNKDFLFTGVFDRFYSQEEGPMYISSMHDTEIFSRMYIVANYTVKTHTNTWEYNSTIDTTNRHGLIFARGLFPEGRYDIKLHVCFVEEPTNCIFEPTFVLYVMPPPHAEIVGSRRRYIESGLVTMDAASMSYDPVFPNRKNLAFTWTCTRYNATTFDDALVKHSSGSSGNSCSSSPTSTGISTLDTSVNLAQYYYVVSVTVNNNRGKTSTFTQVSAVFNRRPLDIICKINCLSKVAVSSKLQLIPDLINNCAGSFVWSLMKKSSVYDIAIDLNSISVDGKTQRSLTIKENTLESGTWYLASVSATIGGIQYGPAYYEFITNRPPQGGFCRIIPYNETTLIPLYIELQNTTTGAAAYPTLAGIEVFNCTCEKWEDEGFTDNTFTTTEPLFYLFYLKYSSVDTQRQLLYFDPGQTSTLVTFQVGDPLKDYNATVVLRITDVFGDYTEVSYNIISKPSIDITQLSTSTNKIVVSELDVFTGRFDDELIKANRTYDYRTISRKVMDIYSVLNLLKDNSSTAGIILSPEDLLSLGYQKSADDNLLGWTDYWKLIVEVSSTDVPDYIIKVGEKYAYMLYASVNTWPQNKRMTLVAIETISRAFNASTAIHVYSNVTAAVLAASCVEKMAVNLANISEDRTFPNTEHLNLVAICIMDVIQNLLAILQTVLTPNLPQDPTVDQMRNYLEYVKIFKTTEEALRSPLSLQEQTFLAQKQLQKYYVQKYIKSEASKKALPLLTYALQNLTYVLGRMTRIGQTVKFIENDYIYISVEKQPTYALIGQSIVRPKVAMDLDSLRESKPDTCNSSEITLRTIVFKNNPYFWGTFADRITSYVPVFDIDGAVLEGKQITYRLKNRVTAACVDKTPTYTEDDPNKMIYILFDRQHAEDDLLIFVRPNTSDLVYKLYFNKNEKPDITKDLYTYSTEMKKNDKTWTREDGYKLLIKANDYPETGKIWIALRPLLEDSSDLSLLTQKFCANVTSVNCLAWRPNSYGQYYWDKDMCEVSLSSTLEETVCYCDNPGDTSTMTVGTTFYVPYNKIDFAAVDETLQAVGRGPVIGMMIASVALYFLLVAWAWREDIKDQYKWSFSLLIDNDIADSHFYIVRVYTGLRTGSGTKSKIGFILVGEDGDTNIRTLDDDSHIGFERGSVRTFVMSTRRYLGDLLSLRIWHDDTGGPESSWYLNKINVTDLQNGNRYTFVCDKWFDYDSGDTRVDRVLSAQKYENVRSYQEMISYTVAENHIWLSLILRPIKSQFTRVQRLSCLLGLVYLTMIICTMILKTPTASTTISQVVIGPFRFSIVNFRAALIAVTIATVIIIIVSFFFKYSESEDGYPNIESMLRKAYRKANDKFKFDNSVLSGKYWSPAEEALDYNYFFLPHFCVYVAWTILAVALVVATYLLVVFSVDWKLVKSEEWMTAIFVAVICSFIIIEGIKIIIILIFFSLLCQRAYEPPEPDIDKNRLKEITRYNSATLTIGPQFPSVLHKPDNPSEDTLTENKIQRIRNHQLLRIFSQLVMFGALLFLVYTISYESRDPRSYALKSHVQELFRFHEEVKDLMSYTKWLNGTFKDTYFATDYFGAVYKQTDSEMEIKSFMQDLTSFRIGPARLRQMRIQGERCIGPLVDDRPCHAKYEDNKRETQDYCLGWQPLPCPVSQKSEYFSSAAWKYTAGDAVWGFPTVGNYSTYGGGGYFMTLDVNRQVCIKIFDEFQQWSWFDNRTRAVILEFTLYNANANLFVYLKFVAEFPEVGGFLPYVDIQVFRLFTHNGPNGQYIMYLEFIFLLIVIASTFKCVHELFTDARAYMKSWWNVLDLIALAMSYTTVTIFIYKIFIINKTIEQFQKDKNAYVGFENLAFYDFIANTAYGVLVYLLSLRVSRILGYSGKINEMASVISNAASDLYGFLVTFGITYFAFVIWGYLLFGKEQEIYKDVLQTYSTLTEAIVGKNKVMEIISSKPIFAEVYYFTFYLFVLMTLATMAAAILNFSITKVKEESKKIAPTNIVEVIADRIGQLINKLTNKGRNKAGDKRKKGQRRGSDEELNDVLSDLRLFLQDIKPNRTRKSLSSEKYKLTDNESQ